MTQKTQKTKEPQKKSLVSPILASIFSAIIPGLGQILARAYQRGIILLASFLTMGGLLTWRIYLEGRRYQDIKIIIQKAFQLSPILKTIAILLVILYIWIIVDAYLAAKKSNQGSRSYGSGLLFFVLAVFFLLGWQIGDINIGNFFSQADEAIPTIGRILWPWEKAIDRPEEILTIATEIQTPCTDVEFPAAVVKEDEPYMLVTPTCGEPTAVDSTPGTEFHLIGGNFNTDQEIEIWWKDGNGNEFRQRQGGEYIKVMPDSEGNFEISIIMPYRLIASSSDKGATLWEVQARQLLSIGEAQLSEEFTLAVEKMIETIIIGMMATLFGVIMAIPLCFLAARNLMSQNIFTKIIYYIVRTILNVIRSIEPLIWAIIATIVVGLGPFAGIIALTIHSIAALAKLYSEAIEGIDSGPIEAIQATGANWMQTIMYAVIPQIVPPFVSFTIYRWDVNIRMSTVIGFVGGGGIGFLLQQWIRLLDYRAAGIAVWFIALTVMILDYVSAEIRERYK
ncbi:MAG: Phosphonate transport system permease protein [Anaerolinea thermophila]|uniref:Phosphonate transport system permease protein n=1 Tax=Anaerolinea thermophila TaxID=167964 RepID=A0A101FYY8_9CHLR|nr:MAG: Phosphonate transport system permease protein [Anaerolinea thermophila]